VQAINKLCKLQAHGSDLRMLRFVVVSHH